MKEKQEPNASPPLLFGIPELDRMLNLKREHFYKQPEGKQTDSHLASIALLGSYGTGKSVFALHLVSRYFADTYYVEPRPKILYVSTDLRFEKADRVWENFALNSPYFRDIPCERAGDRRERKRPGRVDLPSVVLDKLKPTTLEVAKFLGDECPSRIGFIDMASASAGDDWGYMIRALSLLNSQKQGHLVIIDSVAGFETLTGDTDAYGEAATRRARIARVIRAAQDRCHLMFVVEEAKEDVELPEEFVADTVIRLRRRTVGGATHRTLEIEKARGRAHAAGEHPYSILDGLGSHTGAWENPDEPRSRKHNKNPSEDDEKPPTNNYVQIYYSLQYRNQRIKARPGPGSLAPTDKRASFGIQHLDDLLAGADANQKGIRCGKICSLIGDAGTAKSSLAYSFLCEGYKSYAEQLDSLTSEIEQAVESQSFDKEGLRNTFWKIENWLTTKDSDSVGSPEFSLAGIKNARELVEGAKICERKQRPRAEERVLGHDSHVLGDDNPLNISQSWIPNRELYSNRVPMGEVPTRRSDDPSWLELPLRRVQYPWRWCEHNPTQPIEIADWLLRHPAFASPGVLIATNDVQADELAERFMNWLRPFFKKHKQSSESYETTIYNYIAQHLICRRLEADDATAPILFHIIERAILEAQRFLYGPILPNTAWQRTMQSWRIRLVIDNLRIVRDMYPAVRKEPLFLPLLAFYLGREGITGVIVDTDSGRPDKDPSDEINRELRSLVSHQLYTWQVPFFGQKRIAIAAVPSVSARHKGIIREVKLEDDLRSATRIRPKVDPHFELYSGLEEGKPQAVPLSVILYAETPAFKEYTQRENLFFKQVFPSVSNSEPSSDIVLGRSTSEYETLRDLCHMPTDLRLNYSLVFQVDGYWGLQREGSLEDQRTYLLEATTRAEGRESMEDPFHLFQPLQKSRPSDNPAKAAVEHRFQYFQNRYYRQKRDLDQATAVDRIPFTWDFGLLLCKIDPWRLAVEEPLKKLAESLAESVDQRNDDTLQELKSKLTVGSVWRALPKTNDLLHEPYQAILKADELNVAGLKTDIRLDSWRVFLEAAHVVANVAADRLGHAVQPFDFASMAGDSVSTLILEMWFSEIWQRGGETQETIREHVCGAEIFKPGKFSLVNLLEEEKSISETYQEFRDEWTRPGNDEIKPQLLNKLKGYSLELYMTWLLLLEVLDFNSFNDPKNPFDFRPDRSPVQEAVAARHWYKTACVSAGKGEQTGHPSELMVAVRLPGHFSVRGDWFLATAKGSRSTRLAARAVDVLSSRRANIVRLQMGLGLPTRDILEDSQIGQLRTGLRGPDVNGVTDNVNCETFFRKLAAKPCGASESEIESEDFYWLWRSRLQNYDRQSRVWRKWLHRVFQWTHHYHRQHSSAWIGGFKPYDQLRRGDYAKVVNFDSFLQFAEMCDLLIAELRAAAPD